MLGSKTPRKRRGDRHEHRLTTAIICRHPGRDAVPARAQRLADARRDREAGGRTFPSDPASRLLIAIRAHGNAAGTSPALIVLFLLVGARSPAAVAIPLIIGATAARVIRHGLLTAPSLAVQTKARLVERGGHLLPRGRPGRRRGLLPVMSSSAYDSVIAELGQLAPQSGVLDAHCHLGRDEDGSSLNPAHC